MYRIATVLFCLQMSFTAYAQLRLPQVAESFVHLGFPAYFRVELAVAKLVGVVLLLSPVSARWKEWVCGIRDESCFRRNRARGGWRWSGGLGLAVGTSLLWALSYGFWRKGESLRPAV